jgi:hypothetical protein
VLGLEATVGIPSLTGHWLSSLGNPADDLLTVLLANYVCSQATFAQGVRTGSQEIFIHELSGSALS